jgi:hypothetical protein
MEDHNNWKTLLEIYVQENPGKLQTDEEKEKQIAEEFISIMTDDYNDHIIPKFYFKKPEYNELFYSIKAEAKQRFLLAKTYEVPQKRRNIC